MDKTIRRFYKEYGDYTNTQRALPFILDGLRPVERRVLLSAYHIARDKFAKSAKVDGHCIGNYHPHGSSYGVITQMVHQGFLIPQGNFGGRIGVQAEPAAAPRYTEVKLPRFIEQLVFKYLDQADFFTNSLSEKEPRFLPVMFPMCLLGNKYTEGIAFGYKTLIPSYNIKDLYKRLLWLLGVEKNRPTIRPITDCIILSSNDELEKLLVTGEGKIDLQGIIEEDKENKSIILKNWPYDKSFTTILKPFEKDMNGNDIGYRDGSSKKTNIIFRVLRSRGAENIENIYNNMLKKMKEVIKGSISFKIVVVNEKDDVIVASVDEMLLKSFGMFKQINLKMLAEQINKIDQQICDFKLLERIRPILKKYLSKSISADEKYELICKEASIEIEDLKQLLNRYRISKLFSLELDVEELLKQKQLVEENMKNIDKYVLNQYQELLGR